LHIPCTISTFIWRKIKKTQSGRSHNGDSNWGSTKQETEVLTTTYWRILIEWDLRFSQQWGWWCSSGFWRHVDSSVDANVLEKHTVSIFSSEVGMLGSGGIYIVSSLQPWRRRQYASPKHWHPPTSLHGAKTQKKIINTNEVFYINIQICYTQGTCFYWRLL
jgi:hypothetical protein